MAAPTLAVVILTQDEARELAGCLASLLELAPEQVLVVDSGSTDETEAIARRWRVEWHTRAWTGWVDQRNAALEQVRTDWVLFLDADERVGPGLAGELRAALAQSHAGFRLPRRNWYLGKPLDCWSPDRLLRLARVGACRWAGGSVHEVLEVDGTVGELAAPLWHDSYRDLADQHAKHVRYAKLSARDRLDDGEGFRWHRLLRGPAAVWKFLLLKGGWREGRRAWVFALSYWIYSWQKALMLAEPELQADAEPFPRLPAEAEPPQPPTWAPPEPESASS